MTLFNVKHQEPEVEKDKAPPRATRSVREVTPAVDIFENAEELLLVADMPGVDASALNVHFDAPELRIEAPGAAEGDAFHYFRAFRVDERLDPEGISAAYKLGVLEVHLRKASAVRPRRIEVKSA
jgi:HSP20 family protein